MESKGKKVLRFIAMRLAIYPLIALVIFLLAGYSMMERMLLPAPKSDAKFGNITLYSQGATLDAYYLPPAENMPVILFSHGNGDVLKNLTSLLEEFAIRGYGILAYDYAGYGFSTGKAGEKQSYQDILAAYDYLVRIRAVAPEKIIVAGYSVGSGPSCYLTTQRQTAGLVLISAFASAIEVKLPFPLPFNRYNNADILSKSDVPVLIFHGENDDIVPVRNADKLYRCARGKKELHIVKNAAHNDIFNVMQEDFWQKLESFCRSQIPNTTTVKE